ncbi:hypothetical protein J2X36_000338 [Methylobacterium sp. BE186]|uniref:hypothetical protein n=1 Tax=Methylobacterium sp. BE186 TaxID=2817715 RepID=UPI002858BAD6|nr:hypothetical protein [Methylobacterium sp. BE186]MDR7035603.1 hypothetical protein [Methylobacterium sp. BE186]
MARSALLPIALSALVLAGLGGGARADQFKLAPCALSGTCFGPKKAPPIKYFPGLGVKKPGGYGPGWGYGAAALAGGLALGAIAVGAAGAAESCYVERRRMEDEEGNVYVRRVRVCE